MRAPVALLAAPRVMRWALLFGVLQLLGCGSGTETGNPTDTVRLGIGALPGKAPRDLTLEEARVSVPSLFFTACPGAEAPDAADPAALDLLDPSPSAIQVPRSGDTACGATIELGPSLHAEPAALAGLSFRFSGVRADGVPFEITSTFSRHYPLVTNPPDTPLDAASLFIAFDLAVWLDAAAVPTLPVDGGAIVVDSDHNADALTALESAGVHAIALYLDADRDGVLDSNELTPVGTAQ